MYVHAFVNESSTPKYDERMPQMEKFCPQTYVHLIGTKESYLLISNEKDIGSKIQN